MLNMNLFYDDFLLSAAEFIKDRFFFISIKTDEKPRSTPCTHYFSVDNDLVYESFFNDFGPLNISMLHHYCIKVNKKLKSAALKNKRIVHYTNYDESRRANGAYLAASYAIIYLKYTPERAYDALQLNNSTPFTEFRDASIGIPYTISIKDCLNAIYKAFNYGFFNFDDFDYLEYEHYERVENGDLNWIVPSKFIGFCGPHNKSKIDNGYLLHSPETYFSYFRRHKVTVIVRLNKKMYDCTKFETAGFIHKDLYFIDGSTPSDKILQQFINICEKTDGAVAVHCKAGLGRTGSLIGCYIMKHYKFTAKEAIAWVRICRPGSVIGHQQLWLESKQAQLWQAGEEYRREKGMCGPIKHQTGIYSCRYNKCTPPTNSALQKATSQTRSDVSGILRKVDTMKLNDNQNSSSDEDITPKGPVTQGDRLNWAKTERRRAGAGTPRRSAPDINDEKLFRTQLIFTPLEASVLRSGKVRVGSNSKTAGASTSQLASNRNGAIDKNGAIFPSRHAKTNTYSCNPTKASIDLSITRTTNDSNRGKRSLTLEKDKSTPQKKVLRRSHPQSCKDIASNWKLPLVGKNSKKP